MDRVPVRLGEVLRVKHGYAFPGEFFSEVPGFPVVLTPGNFSLGGGFRKAKPKTFSAEYSKEYELKAGDLVVSMTDLSKEGATLGLPALVPDGQIYLHNQRIGLVEITDLTRVDQVFLSYYLRTDAYRSHVLGSASGTTVRHTSPGRIESFLASLPSLRMQRAIAEVLVALDDRTIANYRLATIAEKLMIAKASSVADRIPVSVLAQQSTKTSNPGQVDDLVVHFSLPAFDEGCTPELTQGTCIRSNKFTIDRECVLVSKLNPRISRVWNIPAKPQLQAFASTEFVVLISRGEVVPALLWSALSQTDVMSELASKVSGTSGSHQRVKPADVMNLPIPDVRRLSVEEREAVDALGHLCHALREESTRLITTRDNLLPLLMSGRVRVRDAEKLVEEVV